MAKKKKNRAFAYRMEYFGWKIACFATSLLNRKMAIRLSDATGRLMWKFLGARKKVVQENLQIAFGTRRTPEELDRIGLEAMQGMILTFLEFIRPNLIGEFGSSSIGESENLEYGLARTGEATLVATGHIGNWEAMAMYANHHHLKSSAFVKLMHNPLINREIQALRKDLGVNIVAATAVGKAAVDAVRDKHWLVFLTDQDATSRGIFVDFFGRPASTFKGVAMYAWKFNLPIMPAYIVRNHDKQRSLKLIMFPPIPPNIDADKDEEIQRLTQLHTAALESVIERYPESYFWVHRRWKTQPPQKSESQQN